MAEITKIAMNGILYDICDAKARKLKIVVDPYLSETSSNPVENRVVAKALAGAGGVTVDSELSETSENPVLNKVINEELKEAKESCFIKDYRDKDSIPSDDTKTYSAFQGSVVVNIGHQTTLNRDIDDDHISTGAMDSLSLQFNVLEGTGTMTVNGGTTIFELVQDPKPMSDDSSDDDSFDFLVSRFGKISFTDENGNELTSGVYQISPNYVLVSTNKTYTVNRTGTMQNAFYAYQVFIHFDSGYIRDYAKRALTIINGTPMTNFARNYIHDITLKNNYEFVTYGCIWSEKPFNINGVLAKTANINGKTKYFAFVYNDKSNTYSSTGDFVLSSADQYTYTSLSFGPGDADHILTFVKNIHNIYNGDNYIFFDDENFNKLPATNAEVKAIYDNVLSLNNY